MSDDRNQIRSEFDEAVNMTQSELKNRLGSEQSRAAGVTEGGEKKDSPSGGESVGHESGRRIVAILGKREADLDDGDYDHMRKVVGYVHRHLAQRPQKERSRIRAGATR